MKEKTPGGAVVEAVELSKCFYLEDVEVHALNGVSFSVPEGQFLAVMGPSGTGKSTLLHILSGLEPPTSGSVAIEGRLLSGLSDLELTLLRRRRIGFVFQSFHLVPTISVMENVCLPLLLDGVSRSTSGERAAALLSQVGMEHRLHHLPSQLSGGEQQRVAIARALIIRPLLILADEPTGNLDSVRGREITGLLHAVAREHRTTVIVVTHDPRVASQADRLIVLLDGKIGYDGVPVADAEALAKLLGGTGT